MDSDTRNERWSNTSTVVPTRPVSYADPEKAAPPIENAQPDTHEQANTSAPTAKAETQTAPTRPDTLEWDGQDDPLNPHNWSLIRRWFQT